MSASHTGYAALGRRHDRVTWASCRHQGVTASVTWASRGHHHPSRGRHAIAKGSCQRHLGGIHRHLGITPSSRRHAKHPDSVTWAGVMPASRGHHATVKASCQRHAGITQRHTGAPCRRRSVMASVTWASRTVTCASCRPKASRRASRHPVTPVSHRQHGVVPRHGVVAGVTRAVSSPSRGLHLTVTWASRHRHGGLLSFQNARPTAERLECTTSAMHVAGLDARVGAPARFAQWSASACSSERSCWWAGYFLRLA
jgi:hypothetical protein